MAMTLPVLAALKPPSIGDSQNGQIPLYLLVNVRMHEDYDLFLAPEMASTYEALVADCLVATGVQLGISGGGAYRSLAAQVNLFFQRYESPPRPGRPTRTYNGRTYSLRVGMSSAASPGTSNHGTGGAVDLRTFFEPDNPKGNVSGSACWPWLLEQVVPHRLSWELQDEPWHLRLVALPEVLPLPPATGDDVATYFSVDTHPEDIYAIGPDGGIHHITGPEGAVLEAVTPGWAQGRKVVSLPDDVNATLPK